MEQTFWGKEYLTECEISGFSIRIHIIFLTFLPYSIRSQIPSAIGSAATHQAKTALKTLLKRSSLQEFIYSLKLGLFFTSAFFEQFFCTSASSSMSCTLPKLNKWQLPVKRWVTAAQPPDSPKQTGSARVTTPREYQKAFKLITIQSPSRSDSTRWCRPRCSRDTNNY